MRKFILIAGFVLASAAAQAADRSLSLGGIETKSAPAPAKAVEGSRTAEVPQAAEAPKYVERPAVVEPRAETTKAETSRAETATPRTGRAARTQRYATRPASAGRGRPVAQRTAMMSRSAGAHRMRYSIKARIIGALHRHGIYW
jgi:outer membrane biosynthesis protein TonB